jgi:hypothetical protein
MPPSEQNYLARLFQTVAENCPKTTFTIVGLEGLPRADLVSPLPLLMASLDASHDDWALLVRSHVLAHIHDLVQQPRPASQGHSNPRDPNQPVHEYLEVLTLDEYRARIGDEMFELETYADGVHHCHELRLYRGRLRDTSRSGVTGGGAVC